MEEIGQNLERKFTAIISKLNAKVQQQKKPNKKTIKLFYSEGEEEEKVIDLWSIWMIETFQFKIYFINVFLKISFNLNYFFNNS